MAIIKCKMCGGDLILIAGQSVAECEYCGSCQTVPVADNEKKMTLFARAGRLRAACEFDKAAGIYETIVADFPEEAESYWGLVLCKYGIEYVDDPATSRKIPTCHRSSFESILEDSDFGQAMENADSVARRIYREEAKQIEIIRRGIIAVSANEQPYDIFICYKETDENGERTLDSVLAQDIYDALTSRGYRVFFSRITLEDKLGVEYEPYIFAALNSAKIMLVVGTDYEFYNAVWVKNEWSRYLKLMTRDKNKHLIPCFKGIDAYDMPKEFAKLQAQDLGKMGAIQDILRGVEKLLSRQCDFESVPQQRINYVLDGDVSSKVAAMLERGYLALEDAEWEQADRFFEEVLNHDARNSQGYIGKVLVEQKCSSMSAFLEKRKSQYADVEPEILSLCADPAHIAEAISKFRVPAYVEAETIRQLYDFEYSYPSLLAECKEQYRQEKAWWTNHKLLSRAEKFAAGEAASWFRREKAILFDWLLERITDAEAAEAKALEEIQKRYGKDLTVAEKKAALLYHEAVKMREQDYQILQEKKKAAVAEAEFYSLYKAFAALEGYADSQALAEECRNLAPEIRDFQLEEHDRIPIRKNKLIIAAIVIAAVAAILAGIYLPGVIIDAVLNRMAESDATKETYTETATVAATESLPLETTATVDPQAQAYAKAEQLLTEGEIASAAIAFGKLAGYADSRERSLSIWETITYRETLPTNWTKTDNRWDKIFAALKNDGTVISAFPPIDEAVAKWRDIVAVECCSYPAGSFVMGLKKDGTVVTAVADSYIELNTSTWTDIVAIDAKDGTAVGLRMDGTVVATGLDSYGQCNVKGWTDIVSVYTSGNTTAGLKIDGTMVACGMGATEISEWKEIAYVCASGSVVGIKKDGTVETIKADSTKQYDLSGWTDVISADTGYWGGNVAAVRADGTVLLTVTNPENEYYRTRVSDWTDMISIYEVGAYVVGLKSDGTVVGAGLNVDGCLNVGGWRDIVAIRPWYGCTVGLKSDGTVVYAGKGHKDMKDWYDIKFPDKEQWHRMGYVTPE